MYDLDEIQNQRGLHIAHLNVRSMVNKWDNIKANFMNLVYMFYPFPKLGCMPFYLITNFVLELIIHYYIMIGNGMILMITILPPRKEGALVFTLIIS